MGKRIKDLTTYNKKLAAQNTFVVVDNGLVVNKVEYKTLAGELVAEYNGMTLAGQAQSVKAAVDGLKTSVDDLTARVVETEKATTWDAIAKSVSIAMPYAIGDTISEPWTDIRTGTKYDNPWRVNHYETIETENGEVKGAWLQNVYAHYLGVQFSHYRAFLACPNGLAAGTYHITLGATWGSKDAQANSSWQFTLAHAVESGGCLAGFYGMPDQAASNWKVYNYKADRKTVVETVAVTSGSSGTNLGTLALATRNGNLNSMQETAYGWNRWKTSAMRQYLNSDAAIGGWWTPQDQWDIAPDQLAQIPGFLTGLPQGMIDALIPYKAVTYTNTVQDGGGADTTYDKVGLISLDQMYVTPQIAGEGNSHDYWKQANGTGSKYATGTSNVYPSLVHYRVEAHSTAESVRAFRSANRGIANNSWYVNAGGFVYGTYAFHALRPVPLVFIGL